MSINRSELTWDKVNFRSLCRENTGRHFLDSGDHYGRLHELPIIPENASLTYWTGKSINSASIRTGILLDKCFTIDRVLQKQLDVDVDETWDEGIKRIIDGSDNLIEHPLQSGFNTYNTDTDLDQSFQVDVYKDIDRNEAVYVISTHNGCDIRGGWSRPVFCRLNPGIDFPELRVGYRAFYVPKYVKPDLPGQMVMPFAVERCMEYSIQSEIDELTYTWCTGYSSCPYSRMVKDIDEWLEDTETEDSIEAILNSGHRVRIEPDYYVG